MTLFPRTPKIEPKAGEIEMNIRKLRTRKNSNLFFGGRGPLVGGVRYAS